MPEGSSVVKPIQKVYVRVNQPTIGLIDTRVSYGTPVNNQTTRLETSPMSRDGSSLLSVDPNSAEPTEVPRLSTVLFNLRTGITHNKEVLCIYTRVW